LKATNHFQRRSNANFIRPARKVYDKKLRKYTNYNEALRQKVFAA
jgi:hypothetical protein